MASSPFPTRLLATLAVLGAAPAVASDAVLGQATVFTSPNGVAERCVRIGPMPGARYSDDDRAAEAAFCAVDLYAPTVALCPKTWSTSPGMIVYDVSAGPYAGDRAGFERRACPEGKDAKAQAAGELAKFKPTMNARGTSGTFSASPLLYYHFSRYLEADVGVPPAVWRSMDRGAHLSEVARPGLAQSGTSHSSAMNHTGWRVLVEADTDPSTYTPTGDLYTADRSALFGVMLKSPGSRYNTAVNGTRKSGWGKGQNEDFQETAPFLALRSAKPLAAAVAEAVAQARRDPQMARDLPADVDPRQIVFWMRDVAGIALLDFIFSQQDRIGNIDYTAWWIWAEGGVLKQRRAKHHGPEEDAAPAGAIRVLRTNLNDNDAGARVEYANFAKSTQMLEKMRRFPPATYARLMALDADFRAKGPLYAYVRDSFGLDARQLGQIVANTAYAARILGDACRRGALAFDADPEAFFLTGTVAPASLSCDGR
jgi:hypothetical protein